MSVMYTIDVDNLEVYYGISSRCYKHSHKMLELMYCVDGTHFATINNEARKLEAGDICVSNAYDLHCYTSYDKGKIVLLQLNDFFTEKLFELYPNKQFPHFMTDKEYNVKILRVLRELLEDEKKNRIRQLSLVNHIFFLMIDKYGMQQESENNNVFSGIMRYIAEHYFEDISRKDVAARFGYNENYFSVLFYKMVGLKFKDYINMLRYNRVQDMLENNENKLSKTNIILACGFPSTLSYYRYQKNEQYGKAKAFIQQPSQFDGEFDDFEEDIFSISTVKKDNF